MMNGMVVHHTLRLIAIAKAAPYKGQMLCELLVVFLLKRHFMVVNLKKGHSIAAVIQRHKIMAEQLYSGECPDS